VGSIWRCTPSRPIEADESCRVTPHSVKSPPAAAKTVMLRIALPCPVCSHVKPAKISFPKKLLPEPPFPHFPRWFSCGVSGWILAGEQSCLSRQKAKNASPARGIVGIVFS
jgi:hypothetical protein